MSIHETAIIDKNAEIGENNDIGPNVVIQGRVKLGDKNSVGPGTIIMGNTTIGSNNNIYGHVYIGSLPQDITYKNDETFISIGNNNVIREFATVHRGTKEGSATYIGNNNYLMVSTHVAHNCKVGSNIILVNGASLAGYVEVQDHAFLGGFAIVHQYCRIGGYSMCGVLTKITKDIPPFMLVDGNPALIRGLNLVGLKRKGFSTERREKIKKAFKILYRCGYSVSHSIEELKKFDTEEKDIQSLIDFITSSKRGILLKSMKNYGHIGDEDI